MKTGHVPMRTCRGCGRKAPKAELTRFVLRKGLLHEDTGKRMVGRGAYCCANVACRNRFEKSNKMLKRVFRFQA